MYEVPGVAYTYVLLLLYNPAVYMYLEVCTAVVVCIIHRETPRPAGISYIIYSCCTRVNRSAKYTILLYVRYSNVCTYSVRSTESVHIIRCITHEHHQLLQRPTQATRPDIMISCMPSCMPSCCTTAVFTQQYLLWLQHSSSKVLCAALMM